MSREIGLLRNLFLVAAVVIAVVAIAPTATAVEISAEATGEPCPEVQVDKGHNVTGGCLASVATIVGSPTRTAAHLHLMAEVVTSVCSHVFDVRFHAAGDGWISNQDLEGPNCGVELCDEAAPSHADYEWPATITEVGPFNAVSNPTNEAMQVTLCLRAELDPDVEGAAFVVCSLFIPLTSADPHGYRFDSLPSGPAEPRPTNRLSSRCSQTAGFSFAGAWQINGSPIEVTH